MPSCILKPVDALEMETRAKRRIENEFERKKPDYGKILETKALISEFSDCIHRTEEPDLSYNCHGLTFASRRTNIISADVVETILSDDGYIKIADTRIVMPGDVIIYRAQASDGGEIEHSGIVVWVDKSAGLILPRILVVSKQGEGNEMIHDHRRCKYTLTNIEFYRVVP